MEYGTPSITTRVVSLFRVNKCKLFDVSVIIKEEEEKTFI
jgi:hypothetical protein